MTPQPRSEGEDEVTDSGERGHLTDRDDTCPKCGGWGTYYGCKACRDTGAKHG